MILENGNKSLKGVAFFSYSFNNIVCMRGQKGQIVGTIQKGSIFEALSANLTESDAYSQACTVGNRRKISYGQLIAGCFQVSIFSFVSLHLLILYAM